MTKSIREYRRDGLKKQLGRVEAQIIANGLNWGECIDEYGRDSHEALLHARTHSRLHERKRGMQRRLKEVQEELISQGRYMS